MSDKAVISRVAAAARANVTITSISNWCVSRGIGHRDARGFWRVDVEKLDKIIAARSALGRAGGK
jgi:hypothetical protein